MIKEIVFKEGFVLTYEEHKHQIKIKGLRLDEYSISRNWMGVTDFVAILESSTRNKLGTKNKYHMGEFDIYGVMEENYKLVIDAGIYHVPHKFDIVQVMQIVSKLNKLLHMADKLDNTNM